MRLVRAVLSSILLVPIAAGVAQAAPEPVGLWIDHTGRGAVEITPCGGSLCGRIVWLKDPKNQKACGVQVIGGVRASGGASWSGGWIYSPEKKSRYDVELTPIGSDRLKVFGYAGIRMFGKTMTWTKAPDGLARCGEAVTAGAKPAAAPVPAKVAVAAPESVAAAPRAAAAVPTPVAPTKAAPEAEGETAVEQAPVAAAEAEAAIPEPAVPEDAGKPKKSCTLSLPYVKLSFPCPE